MSVRRRFLWSQAIFDAVVLAICTIPASLIDFKTPFAWTSQPKVLPLLAMMGASLVLAHIAGARLWAGSAPRPSYGHASAIALATLGFTSLGLTMTQAYFSRPIIGFTMVFFLVGAVAHRAVSRRRPWMESLVVITNETGLVDDLRNAPHANVVSVLDPETTGDVEPLLGGIVLAVDLRAVLSDRMAQYVSSCTLAGFDVRAMSQVYEMHTGRMPIVYLAEGWELSMPVLKTTPYLPGKRLVDVALVLATAPITLALSALIALAVRLSSPGPVIFRQTRVGRGGELFTLYKFRTMWEDAERDGPSFASLKDERLTPVGKSLRRFRADELPQLWNVVKGDVGLVGPRPEQVVFARYFAQTIPFYSHRHLVRPGVTGWAQVNYRYADGDADTIDKLTYDLYYVKHMSPWLDLSVLGRSVWTILSGFGAR
jgi:lipopolysaccharide/colanic/teichoic acid biosynthesis glycosyltransferase